MTDPLAPCPYQNTVCPKTDAQIRQAPCEQLAQCMGVFTYRNKRAPGSDGGGTHGLKHRFLEQINGKCGPGTKSWKDHEDQMRGQQGKLRKLINSYVKKCLDSHGPVPEEIEDFATRPLPKDEDWTGDRSKQPAPECNKQTVPQPVPVPNPETETDPQKVPVPAPGSQQPEEVPEVVVHGRRSDGVNWGKVAAGAVAVVAVVAVVALAIAAAPAAAIATAAVVAVVGIGALLGMTRGGPEA